MIDHSKINALVEECISDTDLFLVELQVKGDLIVVRIDGDTGISIEDCVRVSRHLESGLDREETDFKLDVTSAGIGKPFKLHRQYLNHRGKLVEVTATNGTKKKGILMEVRENHILIKEELQKGRKQKQKANDQDVLKEIPMDDILETRATVQLN